MANDFLIPKHKRLTGRAKLQAESERAVKHFLDVVLQDRFYLLAIVTGGKAHWKQIAGKAFRGFLVDDQILDNLFAFMQQEAGPDPKKQYEELQRSELVALKLDKLRGLARFITDEKHLDAVLDKWISDPSEKAALRSQLLLMIKAQGGPH